MVSQTKPYFSEHRDHFVRLLESCKKVMGWCTVWYKVLLFHTKTIITQLWTSQSEEEEERRTWVLNFYHVLSCH